LRSKKKAVATILYSNKYASDFVEAWVKQILRREYRTVGFFPAQASYTEVPKCLRLPADILNTFQKFAVTEPDAREYCLQNKILDPDDFEDPVPHENDGARARSRPHEVYMNSFGEFLGDDLLQRDSAVMHHLLDPEVSCLLP
jgi:hypothetical protein